MNYQRCPTLRGDQAVAHIRTDTMDLKVCATCAHEFFDLGLRCEPLERPDIHSRPARLAAAA